MHPRQLTAVLTLLATSLLLFNIQFCHKWGVLFAYHNYACVGLLIAKILERHFALSYLRHHNGIANTFARSNYSKLEVRKMDLRQTDDIYTTFRKKERVQKEFASGLQCMQTLKRFREISSQEYLVPKPLGHFTMV